MCRVTSLMSEIVSYVVLRDKMPAVVEAFTALLSNATAMAQVMPLLQDFFRAELQLPQRVSAMPFPTTKFASNEFYTTTSSVSDKLLQLVVVVAVPSSRERWCHSPFLCVCAQIFAFMFSFSFLYPAARLLREIVLEKELRMREGMKAMGLSTGSLFASWYITYAFIIAIQATIIALITSTNIFQVSQRLS